MSSAKPTGRQIGRGKHPEQGGNCRAPSPRGSTGWLHACLWPVFVLAQLLALLAIIALGALWVLEGRHVPVPKALAERLEARAEAALETELDVASLSVTAEGAGILRLVAEDIRLIGPEGTARFSLPRATVELGLRADWPPAPRARLLQVEGAVLTVKRRADGSLDLGSDVLSAIFSRTPPRTPVEAAGRVRNALSRPALETLEEIAFADLSFTLDDARSGRLWSVPASALTVQKQGGEISVALELAEPGRIALRATMPSEGPLRLNVSGLLADVPAPDVAEQVPALVWLAPLEADVSGALIGAYSEDGTLERLDGTLEIGPGHLARAADGQAEFDRAQAYFTYRPAPARLTFSQLVVEAPAGRFAASGHAYLHGPAGTLADAVTGQLTLQKAVIFARDGLPEEIAFSGGMIDAHLTLDPFALEIGQFALLGDGAPDGLPQRIAGHGRIAANEEGMGAAIAIQVPELSTAQALRLWPVTTMPQTRNWLGRNLLGGRLIGAEAGVSIVPGHPLDLSLSFRFRDSTVRALGGLPPITEGAGRASLQRDRFTLAIENGIMTPPLGGPIDVSGSAFTIPNTRQRPGQGDVRWRSDGSITSALSLIDQPPLNLMARTGRSVTLADGRAVLEGGLRFPVRRGVTPEDVDYAFRGALSSVRSDALVPGRSLSADALSLSVAPTGLQISGDVTLSGVETSVTYVQAFGQGAAPPQVRASAPLTTEAAAAFGVALRSDLVTGSGRADIALSFPANAPAILALTSDLRGVGLRVPALGWAKGAGQSGTLELEARLRGGGAPPEVDRIVLSAAGLSIAGDMELSGGGGVGTLRLDTARIGQWFDAPTTLRFSRPGRAPDVELRGGRMDLRQTPAFAASGGAGGQGGRVRGGLSRVTLTDDITLTDVRLDLNGAGGWSGQMTGRVNGQAEITGQLRTEQRGRPSLRVTAANAGRVLAAAGAFEEAQGGSLDLTLRPAAQAGHWDGTLSVDGMRVTAAPGLAALLNAISVVGLLDQLNGPGLAFSTIRSAFRLTPRGVEITSASAVGPSLGISAEGIYDTRSQSVELQGVLSPIYFVNAIGQVFTREGEGLFGMTYSVSGSVQRPQVRVNPLAMLTPGVFREIFRAPVPSLPRDGAQ